MTSKLLRDEYRDIPLGIRTDGGVGRWTPNSDKWVLDGHHMVISGTRGGKGVSCVIPAVIDHHGPIIALDVKGEIMRKCSGYRALPYAEGRYRKQIYINPWEENGVMSSYINPFDYLRGDDNLQRDIAVLADGLIRPEKGEYQWVSDLALQIVSTAIEVVYYYPEESEENVFHAAKEWKEAKTRYGNDRGLLQNEWKRIVERSAKTDNVGRSLIAVDNMLQGKDRDKYFAEWAAGFRTTRFSGLDGIESHEIIEFNDRIKKTGILIAGIGDRQKGIIFSHIANCLRWLDDERVRWILKHPSSFRWEDLVNGHVDIYIVITMDQLSRMTLFMRVMLNMALGAFIRRGEPPPNAPVVLAVFDEFTRLGKMERILDIATIAAGSKVRALFIAQDRGSLEDVYGTNGAATLLGSCATARYFGLGAGDNKTINSVVESCKEQEFTKISTTKKGNEVSETTSTERRPIFDYGQVAELHPAHLICINRGQAPALYERIISYSHKDYKDKLDLPLPSEPV